MQSVQLDYGDSHMDVSLPDSATVFQYEEEYKKLPSINSREATRNALNNPHGFPPLSELGGKGRKVVIGFPDRVKAAAIPTPIGV